MSASAGYLCRSLAYSQQNVPLHEAIVTNVGITASQVYTVVLLLIGVNEESELPWRLRAIFS